MKFRDYDEATKLNESDAFLIDTDEGTKFITSDKIGGGGPVTTDKIVDQAVTTNKIADGSVTSEKLAEDIKNKIDNSVQLDENGEVPFDNMPQKDLGQFAWGIADNRISEKKGVTNGIAPLDENSKVPNEYLDLTNYRTSSAQDTIDNKQDENLDNIKSQIENYPNKVVTIELSGFVQGYRHGISSGIRNDPDYITTPTPISVKKGDILKISEITSIVPNGVFILNEDNTYYSSGLKYADFTFTSDANVHFDFRNTSGITPQDLESVNIETASIVANIVDDVDGVRNEVKKIPVIPKEECWKLGDDTVLKDHHCINGTITSTSASNQYCCTDYIPVAVGDVFIFNQVRFVALFGENKNYLATVSYSNFPYGTKCGYHYDGFNEYIIADGELSDESGFAISASDVKYIVPTISYRGNIGAITRLDNREYNCLCLGDSIFGKNRKPYDIPTYIQNITGLKTANCAFGGTTARTHHSATYAPLSFWNIADCINSGDFSSIDINWTQYEHNDVYFHWNVQALKNIDYTKVKYMTVAYGTNDWNLSTNTDVLDNQDDHLDVTTFKGALRYGIEKIASKYPNITICLMSPLYRYWSNSADYSTVDEDSDTKLNAHGVKLMAYVTAMKEVAEEYHLPFFDNYNTMGINKFNAHSYLRDGTHLDYYNGVEKIGHKIAKEVDSI